MKLDLNLKIISPLLGTKWPIPTYGTSGAAGMDVRYLGLDPMVFKPGAQVAIPLGFSIHLSDPRLCAILLPRSGLGSRGLVLANTVGLIDSDYQGEITAVMLNRNTNRELQIEPGERIAQLVILPVLQININVVNQHMPTERAMGGFGSTGKV